MATQDEGPARARRWGRRDFLALSGAGLIAAPAFARMLEPTALAASRDMLIVNALGGLGDPNEPPRDEPATPPPERDAIELPRRVIDDALASGMDAVNITIGHVAGEAEPFEFSVRELALWDPFTRSRPELIRVYTAADIERARAAGKLGVIYGFQNATMLGQDARRVDLFADLGVRVFQLTYNPANRLGGGAMAEGDPPLTDFGRETIERVNAARAMVDLSHSGTRTCLDAARASARPISINHTGCRALADLPRNKSDEELRLVATRGGFIGIYFMPFLAVGRQAGAADVVAHIEHAIQICGEDHVGIGTDGGTTGIDDWDAYRALVRVANAERAAAGIAAPGEGLDVLPLVPELTGPGQFHALAERLVARGHSTARIEKVMGLNFLAFAREIWR